MLLSLLGNHGKKGGFLMHYYGNPKTSRKKKMAAHNPTLTFNHDSL